MGDLVREVAEDDRLVKERVNRDGTGGSSTTNSFLSPTQQSEDGQS